MAVYEKQFGNKKILIWDSGNAHHVILVSKAWSVLYRLNQFSSINARDPQDKINITWSAHLTNDKRYDTILAAEVADQRIKKVIVKDFEYTGRKELVLLAKMNLGRLTEEDILENKWSYFGVAPFWFI